MGNFYFPGFFLERTNQFKFVRRDKVIKINLDVLSFS
jgi:hypothetical protein